MQPWQKSEFNILKKEKISNPKIIKDGPRYFIAQGELNHQPVVFKSTLPHFEIKYNLTKINKEISFLKTIQLTKNPLLTNYTSEIIKNYQNKNQSWYIKKYYPGEFQNIGESNFLFKATFFNQNNLDSLISFFKELDQNKEAILKKDPYIKKLEIPKNYATNLIKNFHWQAYRRYLDSDVITKLSRTIIKYGHLLENSPRTICHYEPFPSHILKTKNGLKIIDWENVNLSSQAQDICSIWIRSYSNPAWQKKFLNKFKQNKNKDFNYVWDLELLLQCLGNIGYFNFTEKKDELKHKDHILNFLITSITNTLKKYK